MGIEATIEQLRVDVQNIEDRFTRLESMVKIYIKITLCPNSKVFLERTKKASPYLLPIGKELTEQEIKDFVNWVHN